MPTIKSFAWTDPSQITLLERIVLGVDIAWTTLGLAIQLFWGDVGWIGVTPVSMLKAPPILILT